MIPSLENALAACDDIGVTLWLESGSVKWRCGDEGFPDDIRGVLRDHRGPLTTTLTSSPRNPDPDPVPFLSRRLSLVWYPFALTRTAGVVWGTSEPHYRVTPRVWAYFAAAVDRAAEANVGDPGLAQAATLLAQLGQWVSDHYRPDQIERAIRRQQPLPDAGRTPPPLL